MSSSRREFLTNTSKLLAASTLGGLTTSAIIANDTVKKSAADKIVVALIGCRSMGFGDLQNALKVAGVECGAICDIDQEILDKRSADIVKIQGKAPLQYKDYRKLMENKDINAVIIGTPDHWHCLPFVAACEAGKDIYVEKPLANTIGECELMVAATRKYNLIVQVGQQQRSGPHWKQAMNFINAGNIGQLRKVNIWANFNYGTGQPIVADETPPLTIDFDMWLGPAPKRSFNRNRFHGSWRMFWDYGGGLMTDWGVHLLDMALWAKEIKDAPTSVTASGGNFAFTERAHETFDTMSVSYQLKDFTINWDHTAGIQSGPYGRAYGLAFVGNNATLVIDRDGWELFPEMDNGKYKVPAMPKQPGRDSHEPHMKNFIDCIRTRTEPVCSVENGRLVALYAHMANIALRTNSRLEWNNATKNFGSNTAANALITPIYRKPFVLPKI